MIDKSKIWGYDFECYSKINWWCVTFPTLCQSATSSEFEEAAVEAGFSQILTDTLTESDGFEIRFYLLDVIGKLENMLYEA